MALKYKAPVVEVQDEPFEGQDVKAPVTEPVPEAAPMQPETARLDANARDPNIGPGGLDLTGIPTHDGNGRPLNMRNRLEIHHHRETEKLAKARVEARHRPAEPPRAPVRQPVAPAIRAQTERELAAGRAVSAAHAQHQAQRTYPAKPEPWESANTPIFRPSDFIEEKDPAKSKTLSVSV